MKKNVVTANGKALPIATHFCCSSDKNNIELVVPTRRKSRLKLLSVWDSLKGASSNRKCRKTKEQENLYLL